MSSLAISKLKTLLQEQVLKQDEAGESGSSAAVIEAVWKNHPEAVKTAAVEYANSMMARLLGQLANCNPTHQEAQGDLFEGYSGLRRSISVPVERDGKTEQEWKPLTKATLGQLGSWLSDDHRTDETRRQREPGMAKLFRDLSETAKGRKDLTVEDAMKLRRARGGK
jgi:hypothetical protein